MKTVTYRRVSARQPVKAIAIARAVPTIPVPARALMAAGALTLIATLALRGLL